MNVCPHCKLINTEWETVCDRCGKAIPPPQTVQATNRDYDLACPECEYNLRGVPPLSDDYRVRCPECGHISVDSQMSWRTAVAAGLCGECGHDLKGLPRLGGSGVLLCPWCEHPHVQLTGVYLNHRKCERQVACQSCGKSLRGTEFRPHSQIVTCPECGGWNSSTPIPPFSPDNRPDGRANVKFTAWMQADRR